MHKQDESTCPPLYNRRIDRAELLIPPQEMRNKLPLSEKSYRTVQEGRAEVEAILDGRNNRFLLIIGPCSIHDPVSALDYAQRLMQLRKRYADIFCIIMRVYFEKPRTGLGWRGLIVEPGLDGMINIASGLEIARKTLKAITELGLPTASELLDPIVPQYTADFLSWASIGARSAESQIHRELASGLSMAVGFKNPTDGDIQTAVNAIVSAREPHAFLGTMDNGCAAVMHTSGNQYAHLVLRGSMHGTNYSRTTIETSSSMLTQQGIPPALLVDCSHGNSQKDTQKQRQVFLDCLNLRLTEPPAAALRGCMLESFIQEGTVPMANCRTAAAYGTSITDPCMGWEMTAAVLEEAAALWKRKLQKTHI
ncbi:3-deoxy-7-phosphoheptulonate synthase [Treponema sp.]|uniref:3-deoxy-7-phosphoheptulonate synthase n=1 Tax=Treponema sp. TaxID=166 RepID=UPI003FA2D85E